MWKRIAVLSLLCSLTVAAAFIGWVEYRYRTFVDRSIHELTGVSTYEMKRTHRDNASWGVELRIRPTDGEALTRRYSFHPGFAVAAIEAHWAPEFVHDCLDCSYAYEPYGHLHRYRLFILSNDKTDLTISEVFSDM